MSNPALGVQLHGAALLVGVLLVAYLVLVQPLVGRWNHGRLARRARHDPDARLHRYRRSAVIEWLLVALTLLYAAAAPGLTLRQLGLRAPRGTAYTWIGLLGIALTLVIFRAVRGRLHASASASPGSGAGHRAAVPDHASLVGPEAVLALLPRTVRERRAFARLAVTAGSCEEVLYRGLFLAVCTAAFPTAGAGTLVALSAAGFGVAHLYQGPWGMLATAVVGGCLAVLYLGSGSLLLPVCYHILLDLRVLLLPPQPDQQRSRRARHRA